MFLSSTQADVTLSEKKLKTYKPTHTLIDRWGAPLKVDEVSQEKLTELLQFCSNQKDIPFKFIQDGSHAKSSELAKRLENKGVNVVKIFAVGDLGAKTTNESSQIVDLDSQSAILLYEKIKNDKELKVIDPTLFLRPVTVAEWANALVKPSKRIKIFYSNRFQYTTESPPRIAWSNDDFDGAFGVNETLSRCSKLITFPRKNST